MAQLKGIDVSRWQGVIDWNAVKGATDFAIIKSSGGDDGLYTDSQFARNRDEARRTGILRGFYHFAGGVYSGEREADYFVDAVGQLQKGEVLVLDWEVPNANPVAWCLAFLKRVEARTGLKPLIYVNGSTAQSLNWQPVVDNNNGLWVASWGANNGQVPAQQPAVGKWPFWAIWQYSSVGQVAGIGGRVDTNLFNGDRAQFEKYGSASGADPKPAPSPAPAPSVPAGEGSYTVKAGDTLSSIAARYGTNWQTLWAMNRNVVADPNRIFPNQVLKVPGGTPPSAPDKYTVQQGDNLSSIAAKFGTTWQQLYNWNRDVIGGNPNLIKAGQQLRVR